MAVFCYGTFWHVAHSVLLVQLQFVDASYHAVHYHEYHAKAKVKLNGFIWVTLTRRPALQFCSAVHGGCYSVMDECITWTLRKMTKTSHTLRRAISLVCRTENRIHLLSCNSANHLLYNIDPYSIASAPLVPLCLVMVYSLLPYIHTCTTSIKIDQWNSRIKNNSFRSFEPIEIPSLFAQQRY